MFCFEFCFLLFLFSHDDGVDGDEDDLDEDTEEAEGGEADEGHGDGFGELVVVRLLATLDQSLRVGNESFNGNDEVLVDKIHFVLLLFSLRNV